MPVQGLLGLVCAELLRGEEITSRILVLLAFVFPCTVAEYWNFWSCGNQIRSVWACFSQCVIVSGRFRWIPWTAIGYTTLSSCCPNYYVCHFWSSQYLRTWSSQLTFELRELFWIWTCCDGRRSWRPRRFNLSDKRGVHKCSRSIGLSILDVCEWRLYDITILCCVSWVEDINVSKRGKVRHIVAKCSFVQKYTWICEECLLFICPMVRN